MLYDLKHKPSQLLYTVITSTSTILHDVMYEYTHIAKLNLYWHVHIELRPGADPEFWKRGGGAWGRILERGVVKGWGRTPSWIRAW